MSAPLSWRTWLALVALGPAIYLAVQALPLRGLEQTAISQFTSAYTGIEVSI